jgi:hypothetical protein
LTHYYAFNGDADGLCAVQQMRLAEPGPAQLVTGVKRDINLLHRVSAAAGDHVIVLDISLDANRTALINLLHTGVAIRYFDHHHAGDVPRHSLFEPHIDCAADVCTSILVDRYLHGRHRAWAITAAYGDGLPSVAATVARAAGIEEVRRASLENLGICLNYNAYGETVADLHVHPAVLAEEMLAFADPIDFVKNSPTYVTLAAGYADDMGKARALVGQHSTRGTTVVILPAEAWARRVVGVLANELIQAQPGNAIAVASPKRAGGYSVSVRVPRNARMGADDFCLQFATGGGRRTAGGINHLVDNDLDAFSQRFQACFRTAR